MDLSEKLKFYKQQSAEDKPANTIPPSLKALRDHFNGEILFDHAPVLKIQKQHSYPDYSHKQVAIKLISKNEFSEPIPRDECVFFDLETTGLAGGAGTFAFLIGFAYWNDERIITEQFFLPDFGREYELFNQIQEWLSEFEYIVSFNGKSYDMPLLSNRFVLNRLNPGFKQAKHVDLIHMCRRVWKNSMSSCTLKSIEQHLLNIHRSNDIPGEFIPQAYFDFINTCVIHDIVRMIDHNLQDIISMPLILDRLHYIHEQPDKLKLDNAAIASLAKIAFEINDKEYFRIHEKGDVSDKFKFWQSLFYKKNNRLNEAYILWQQLMNKPEYCFFAIEESAKYLEHSKKDLSGAIQLVNSAFKRLDLQIELGYQLFDPQWQHRFQKRRERLLRKETAQN